MKLNRWGLCVSQEKLSLASELETQKEDRRMKPRVVTAQLCMSTLGRSRELELAHTWQVAPDSPTGGLRAPLSVLGRGRRAAQVVPGMLQGRVHTLLTHTCLPQQCPCRYACAHSCCSFFLLLLLRTIEAKRDILARIWPFLKITPLS